MPGSAQEIRYINRDENTHLWLFRNIIKELQLEEPEIFTEELKEELIKCGHKFKTKSDTEVIIHGYEEYGYDIVNKLRGMFAFVIWDKKNEKLFGARDYFGIKPFYYYLNEDKFIYGSEIKSFLEHPNFKKELNTNALENYLTFQYSPTNETFFKKIIKNA